MSLHPPAPAQHQRHNNCKVWYLVWLHCGKLSRFMTDAPHCCTLGRVQHYTMANLLLYNPNLVQKETRFAIPRHFSTMWQCVVYFTLILTLFPSSSCFICHNVSKCEVYSWNARSVVVRCCVLVCTGASGSYLPACGHSWNFVVVRFGLLSEI